MAYPSVTKIPRKIDLAIIATPAHLVPQIVEECGSSGVAGAIITSAGFREAGEEGAALEQKILIHQKKYGIRIIGPNSFGIIRPKINLYATFGEKRAKPGKIAFISQSAALCAAALDWALEAQVGFSAVVSTGSILDVDFGDLIDFFGADPQTRSIVLYLESIRNAHSFMSAARGFARTKPVVVVKAGRFKESIASALSHSGILGGEDAVYDAAFKRAGIVRVDGIADLFNCAEALAMQPNPSGPNLTIITNAGGPGIMATDSLVGKGGQLSKLSQQTVDALKANLPPYCSVTNPVDLFEEATPERFRKVLEICLHDTASSGYLIIHTPQNAAASTGIAKVTVELASRTAKPILVSLMGSDASCRTAKRLLQRSGIPVFDTPEQAVATFMSMYSYTQNLELLYQTPEEFSLNLSTPGSLKAILQKVYSEGRLVLTLLESLPFLEAYGIPTAKTVVAQTAAEAELQASRLGYPIVMKAISPQITHKSRAEAVILNVCSGLEVEAFFCELRKRIKKHSENDEFSGVAIQPMIRGGCEFFIGSKRDPQFGSVLLFGTGGTNAEVFNDVNIGLPPLNQVLAKRLIEDANIYKQTQQSGVRFNQKAVEEVLVRFSQLVIDFPEIREIDVNPLIVNSSSALAVDARIVIDQDRINKPVQPHEHLVIAPYPRKYISEWKLKNGTPVTLRPIRPEDETRFNDLFKSLSPETMRLRFFEVIKELSHETLTRYCNIDYDREVAFVAELKQDTLRLIGAVRLIVDVDRKSGEFAVLVGDRWQSLGLGSKLMDSIINAAKELKLKELYGDVMASNHKMLKIMDAKGFKREMQDDDTIRVNLQLE